MPLIRKLYLERPRNSYCYTLEQYDDTRFSTNLTHIGGKQGVSKMYSFSSRAALDRKWTELESEYRRKGYGDPASVTIEAMPATAATAKRGAPRKAGGAAASKALKSVAVGKRVVKRKAGGAAGKAKKQKA